ncbi:MAG: GumC family protein [Blastocatellia bacterium]
MRPRDLIEYFEILWRKKLLIFLVAAPVVIAAFLVIRRIPNLYESHAVIIISNPGSSNDERLLPGASLAALTQQMTSYGNLATIIRHYGLYRQATGRIPDLNAQADRMRKAVKFDIKMRNYYPEAPESLTISYRYTDPEIARRVVADLVSTFENANVTMRRQAVMELERFRAKSAEIETQLQDLAPRGDLTFLRGEATRQRDDTLSATNAQRLATSDSINSLSDKEFMLERQIDEQKRQIAEQERLVKSAAPANGLASNSAYGILLARRAEFEGQLKEIATFATEKNPKMIQVRAQLAAINQEIARLEAASSSKTGEAANSASPEARELRVMRRELQRLETEVEVTRRDLSRKTQSLNTIPGETPAEIVPSGGFGESKTEYDRLIGRYNWLIDKQESLQKLAGEDGQKIMMFQVIDAPLAQPAPVGPNRMLLGLVGLGIALALGLLAAAALEFPRLFLIHDDRDVEYYLGAPVLALIPETLTPFERRRQRRLWGLRWLGVGMLLCAMIPVFVIALDRAQIFQILGSR